MLPSLFAYEGSTRPVEVTKRSSLRKKQVVQVEVSEREASVRERRSETPSPEDMTEPAKSSGNNQFLSCLSLYHCPKLFVSKPSSLGALGQ